MKKKETNEENMFQKYDDLFDQQDKKYDTNNSDRYAKKKNVVTEDVEYQRYEPKKTESTNVNKSMIYFFFALFVVGVVIFGFTNFAVTSNVPVFIIIGIIAFGSSFFKKNKKK